MNEVTLYRSQWSVKKLARQERVRHSRKVLYLMLGFMLLIGTMWTIHIAVITKLSLLASA